MSEFHKEEDHGKGFALLFASHDIENKFKERVQNTIPYSVIKDKEENRFNSMLHSAGEIGAHFYKLQMSAVAAIAFATSEDEAAMMSLGFIQITPTGVAICPTCLAKAITACEENLTILKDIQEAIKDYANKF